MPRVKHSTEFCCTHPRCEVEGKARRFAKHQLKVHAEKTLKCQHCSKAFSVAYLLRQHEIECNTSVTCKACGAIFAYQSSLKRHYKTADHGPTSGLSSGQPVSKSLSSKKNFQKPTIVTILPLHIVPVYIPTPGSTDASNMVNTYRKERLILPKRVTKKAASVQVARRIQPKLTVSTQVSSLDYDHYRMGHKESQACVDATKTLISVSTSTVAEKQIFAPSISTQTNSSTMCNVAVGIDEVLDDLQKLFEKSSTNSQITSEISSEQHNFAQQQLQGDQNQHNSAPQSDYSHPSDILRDVSCSLTATTNFHHAETQTYQPRFAHTHIQTSYYDNEAFDGSFLSNSASIVPNAAAHQQRAREPAVVHVGVGGPPFDERIFGHMEVQTTSFEPQVQNFGMQTALNFAGTVLNGQGNIAETQTLCVSALDGFSQTGSMELSSVETQTIEQFFNSLENP
ncbi:ATM interactor-like isoform X2 [Varroa jacobsoni]|uniref:ATM interactor-like isoform X2 n=1 Tax=Varroa jacobsoni TaxID=62625 RepID=UPI000BF705A4|nr:ATM interactor-like isoform X2 [Varroa jacobsoni]